MKRDFLSGFSQVRKEKVKLLYLHNYSVTSQEAHIIQVLQMCYAFSDLGHEVTLAVAESVYGPDSIKEIISQKFNKKVTFSLEVYPKFTLNGRFSTIGGYKSVRRILDRLDIDCCFVRNPVLVNATIKNCIPTIFESHNSSLHNTYRLLDFFWQKNLIKNCRSRNLVKFITISNALAEVWKSRDVPEEKIMVLHDGVDPDSFLAIRDQSELRGELGLPLHKKIVLYAGSLYLDRGIENILHLAKSFPHVFFFVVGGPEGGKNYYSRSSKAQNIKNIVFVGYIPYHKVKDYLCAADVLLMVWSKEVKTINYCSPLKMFEYMAAGRIIVGHAFPTIKEVLKDGETAYLANPNSFEDLKMKLALALEQTYPNPMAKAAQKLSFEKYSWKTRAKAILEGIEVSS